MQNLIDFLAPYKNIERFEFIAGQVKVWLTDQDARKIPDKWEIWEDGELTEVYPVRVFKHFDPEQWKEKETME